MNVFSVGFRLYLNWFILVHILGIFVFSQAGLYGGIISEIIIIPAFFFLAQISAKRHQYFFNNYGFSQTGIFFMIGGIHLAGFSILTGMAASFF